MYFRRDNTDGYTDQQLAELNDILDIEIQSYQLDIANDADQIQGLAERIVTDYDTVLNAERIILDNGGGLTLQLRGWTHQYDGRDGAECAAQDIVAWLETHSTDDWDGRESECAVLDPTHDEMSSGGYRVIYLDDLGSLRDTDHGGGRMEADIRSALIARGII